MVAMEKIISPKIKWPVYAVLLLIAVNFIHAQTTIFTENFGNPSANTSVNTYTGYQNYGVQTYTAGTSGTDVRTTNASSGYSGASGQGNVLLSSTKFIEISGINTSACSSFTLSMGVRKSTNAIAQPIIVQVSSDGVTYTTLSYTNLPTGSGTAGWYYITLSGTIPSAANLRIKITGNDGSNDVRIDDIKLTGNCGSNAITTGTVSAPPFALPSCSATASGTVNFTSSGTFNSGNVYTAQLSDASGSFAVPVSIGTLTSTANSGTINVTIPAGTPSGTGYIIRIVSSNPSVTGSNSAAFTITLTCNTPTATCSYNGAMSNANPNGCGDGSGACNLASIYSYFGTFCGSTANVSCTSCTATAMSTQYTIPSGCTAVVTAEFKKRGTGCSNSGMDSGDQLSITNLGGTVSGQSASLTNPISGCTSSTFATTFTTSSINSGCGNSDGVVTMTITGGQVTISGTSDRGDEIITFSLSLTGTCGTNCNLVLPVSLIDFYATQNGGKNDIVWKIAREESVANYIIEKSADGVNFNDFYWTAPNAGRNEYGSGFYTTEDPNPFDGITYYRLTTREADGTVLHYKTIAVNKDNRKWDYLSYQQGNQLLVEFKNYLPKESHFALYDLSGRKLISYNLDKLINSVDVSDVAEGIYIVNISTPYKTENVKVVIQK